LCCDLQYLIRVRVRWQLGVGTGVTSGNGRLPRLRTWRDWALVGAILAIGACNGPAPPQEGAALLVGAPISLSGSLSSEGQLVEQGYEMWQQWVNSNGGINVAGIRHRVRLLLQDDQSRPDLDMQVATNLARDGAVQFLLGPNDDDSTAAVALVAEHYRIPLVEGAGVTLALFMRGFRYTFGVASPTDQYTVGMMYMLAGLFPKPLTIALLSADDQFSQEVAQSAKTAAHDRGLQIVLDLDYPANSTDMTAVVARAAAAKPDIVIDSGHLAEAVAIQRACRTLSLDAKAFVYSVGPSVPEFIAKLGPDADYVFTVAQWTPQVRYQAQMYLTAAKYVLEYRRYFRTLNQPAYETAQATAAGLALQRAIETAGTTRPEAVRDALASLDVATFFGRLKFDSRGANVYKPMVVEQIQRSRLHTVYPPSVADAAPNYPTPAWAVRA
jgi:branched-chain amino acid transport system substrate-binding protein